MSILKFFIIFFLALSLILILLGVFFGGNKNINIVSSIFSQDYSSLLESPNERWDILILGYREENPEHGGKLTDSILVLSYNEEMKSAVIFSIPRDLWVYIPNHGNQRINYAYITRETKRPGEGLELAKQVVNKVTGLDIDYAIALNVYTLKKIVDILGGIEIEEDKYFSMVFYGKGEVHIKPGKNYLSGKEVLAYVGSRDIDNDFGRMKRQQKVILAIKDKVFSLNLLARPNKILKILDTLKKDIKTDIPFSQIKNLLPLVSNFKIEKVRQIVFDTSNYLYATHTTSGAYILLPKKGDFSEIQEKCENVFKEINISTNKKIYKNDELIKINIENNFEKKIFWKEVKISVEYFDRNKNKWRIVRTDFYHCSCKGICIKEKLSKRVLSGERLEWDQLKDRDISSDDDFSSCKKTLPGKHRISFQIKTKEKTFNFYSNEFVIKK